MTEVQVIIRDKEFMQYPSPMKSEVNTRNPNKFYFFHHDHEHDTKECHVLKKKNRNIDSQRLLLLAHEKRNKT
jgi:hypothetical protein